MKLALYLTLFASILLRIHCQDESQDEKEETPKFVSPYNYEARMAVFEKEKSMAIGGAIKLNEKETLVNDIIMYYKRKELDAGMKNPEKFPPARHFFLAKEDIEASKVFSILRKLPKGANLHVHLTVATSAEYLYDLTMQEDLHICIDGDKWMLRFFGDDVPEDHYKWKKQCDWKLLRDVREQDPDFEQWFQSRFTMVVDKPYEAYPSTPKAWKAFEERVTGIKEMLQYWPVSADHFYQMLEEMHEDNVMYVEFKSQATGPYLLNNTAFSLDAITYWSEVLRGFKEENPGFWGAKIVYTHNRKISNGFSITVLNTFNKFAKLFPEFVAGFDLSGFEDGGRELSGFAPFIRDVPHLKPLLLHAGETNWYGSTDNNLIEAILMDAKRIGHALALPKHPELMRLVKEKAIAIEVCPISNQILRYVDDMRNHPAAVFFANDLPVVIANDGPSFWGYSGLSYDWYMAFMGIASRDADLRMLKQLAINSILHSTMEGEEKFDALDFWQVKWNEFIDEMLILYKDSDIIKGKLNETIISTGGENDEVPKDEL